VGLALTIAVQFKIPLHTGANEITILQVSVQVLAALAAVTAFALANNIPPFAILTAGLTGAIGWLVYIVVNVQSGSGLGASFVAAFTVGVLAWLMARWQGAPITIYVVPAILPLLPGLTIYQGMLALTQNQGTTGIVTLIHAIFQAGALAAGVALSSSLVSPLLHLPKHLPKNHKS
jgi:uncharacterized membrane protein YjjB (DUF3815 family)